jgi:gluconokinase
MILLVMGVSGSGKTTVARALSERLGWIFADADDFHSAAAKAKMHAGLPLTDEDRAPWLARIADWIAARDAQGQDCILACSALRRAYRDILAQAVRDLRIVYLHGDRELIASRLRHRTSHFMPAELLDSQIETLEEPAPDEGAISIDVANPLSTIVDTIVRDLGLTPAS